MKAGQKIPVGSGSATVLPDFDFETYSEAGYVWDGAKGYYVGVGSGQTKGLGAVGAAVYAEHPSTAVLSLSYDLKDGKGPRLWVPGCPPPQELFSHLAAGGLIEAWNSGFEYLIWKHVCHGRMGWPELPQAQIRCAMAKGKAFGLPGKLGKATEVLGTSDQKDKRGEQLIRLLCTPQKPTKKNPALRNSDSGLLGELYAYNIDDIRAEAAVSRRTPDLSPEELDLWQLDQRINQRGIHIDRIALDNCISIVEQAFERYNAELRELTGGAVQAASELQKLQTWLAGQGVVSKSLDKDHLAALLKRKDLPPQGRRALEIRQAIGAASVKKLFAILRMLPTDSRLKGLFAYCGADRTGRWAGRGPQPQNLPNSGPEVHICKTCSKTHWAGRTCCDALSSEPAEWGAEAVEAALTDIATRNLDWVESYWGDAVAAVAGCLRGLFSAAPDHDLLCSDFSAIEAVVTAFLAGEEWRMEVFRTHGKIYEAGASKITGVPLQEFLDYPKLHNGAHHPLRKKIGKPSELGFGFGGGVASGKVFGADKFMTDDEIQDAVTAWRKASPRIANRGNYALSLGLPLRYPKHDDGEPGLWYGLQGAAYRAIRTPGSWHEYRGIGYGMKDGTLYCRLLSGRFLTYHGAKLEDGVTPWGSTTQRMTYMGWNTNYLNGPIGWIKMDTYGPKLTENCLAEGTQVLTDRGYVAIEDVCRTDRVHDGVEFVNHSGSVFTTLARCVKVDGVFMTPDHEVLNDDGWKAAGQTERPYRPDLRDVDCDKTFTCAERQAVLDLHLHLWWSNHSEGGLSTPGNKAGWDSELRVRLKGAAIQSHDDTREIGAPNVRGMAVHAGSVSATNAPGMAQLRRKGDQGLPRVAEIRTVLGGHVPELSERSDSGSEGQQCRVLAGELPVGHTEGAGEEQTRQCADVDSLGRSDRSGGFGKIGHRSDYNFIPDQGRVAVGQIAQDPRCSEPARVFDILNCGPRHRFVVLGESGPFIVHNCVQATARDIMGHSMKALDAAGYPIVLHVHDEIVSEVPSGTGSIEEFERIMATMPAWCADWPIRAAGGWRGRRYRKD